MSNPASRLDVAVYLVALTGISAASIGVLYGLYVSEFPTFLSAFTQDPAGAVRADPTSPMLVLAGIALVLLLVALVVVFGARHGPDPDRESPVSRDQHGRREE